MATASVDDESEPLRPQTRDLIKAIVFDVWPSHGTIIDFGLDSQAHYEAISAAYRHGDITAIELDVALGDGPKLTELVRSSPRNPHKGISFFIDPDGLLVNDATDAAPMQGLSEQDQAGNGPWWKIWAGDDRHERFEDWLASGMPVPKGFEIPNRVYPPERSDPGALLRVEGDIDSLKNAVFDSARWVPFNGDSVMERGKLEHWAELNEFTKLELLEHWIDWQGVAISDMAMVIAGSVDLEKSSPATLDRLMHDGGILIEEPAAWWERLSPSQIADNGTQRLATSGGKPMSPSAIADSKPPRPESGHSRNPDHER